ncbi:hypothetical protein [Nocardioides houyundeii]|uniref:hypothetical protein n=1 Tax=Nocardioides houyundeii TaxID=2045452 RepID=UPI000C7709AB|nr:hypothetical protein [Nocardioides houyundeii]
MRHGSSPVLGLVITLALCTGCSGSGAQQPTAQQTAQQSATRTGASSATPAPTTPAPTTPAPTGTASAAPGGQRPATSGGAEVSGVGTSAPTSLPGLRESRPTPALLRRPLPAAASVTGGLTPGFPGYLRPVRGSRVTSSSLSPAGSRLQVALEASTTLPAAEVLLAYRGRLAARGMAEEPVAAVAGSEAAGLSRGRSSVVVTVRREGSRTTYTVYGVLHAGPE